MISYRPKMPIGYNIGIAAEKIKDVKIFGRKEAHYKIPEKDFPYDPKKPRVKLLGTGGTIVSTVRKFLKASNERILKAI